MVTEYAEPSVPSVGAFVMVSADVEMVIEYVPDFEFCGVQLSFTVMVALDVPDVVGVPEITPDEFMESPAGRLVADHV